MSLKRTAGFLLGWFVLVGAFTVAQPGGAAWVGVVSLAAVLAAPGGAWWLAARTDASTGRFAVFASVAFLVSLLGAVVYFSVLGWPSVLSTVVFLVAAGAAYALAYVDGRLPEAVGVGEDRSEPEYDEYPYG